MKFSVFSDFNNPDKLAVAKELLNVLDGTNCKVSFDEKYVKAFDGFDCVFLPSDKMYNECDIAVAVGGDGTTVKTAKNAAVNGKPTLGINGGRLGFLSAVERNELALIKNVLDGKYNTEERILLKATVSDNGVFREEHHCLNDAVVSRGDFARLVDIAVNSSGREIITVRADGIIVSTPTGSTAYSLAAGGPVLSPDLNCFVVTSICPHSLVDRSIVVNSKNTLDITLSSDVQNNGILTCDGEKPIVIDGKTTVSISHSPYVARLIKIKPDNFYETVKKKIIERGA